MKKYFFGAILLTLFSAQISEAAPAPWGIAINTESKECAGYWAGDEFVDYKLPEGWKANYPTSDPGNNLWDIVRTDAGDCSFQIRKEEACCMELGYAFVSDNIGKGQKTILRDRESFNKQLELQRKYGKYALWLPAVRLVALAIIPIVFIGIIIFVIWRVIKKRNNLPRLDVKE